MSDFWPMFLAAHARDMHGCDHIGPPGRWALEGEAVALEAAQRAYAAGAAWTEAEAAMPEGWGLVVTLWQPGLWTAECFPDLGAWLVDAPDIYVEAETQADALRSIVARLREL